MSTRKKESKTVFIAYDGKGVHRYRPSEELTTYDSKDSCRSSPFHARNDYEDDYIKKSVYRGD